VLLDPLVIVRTVHFSACTVAMGTLAFAILVARVAAARTDGAGGVTFDRRCRGLALAALALAGVSGALWLVLIARNILDVPFVAVLDDGGLAAVALDTRFGRIACLRLLLVAAAAVLLRWNRNRLALTAATVLMASIALTGHAGAGTGMSGLIHVVADVVHLVAAGVWLGALPALAWLLWTSRAGSTHTGLAADVTRRFGTIALVAVVALLASGIVNTAILVGWPSDPLATTYARALAVKVGLFAVMLALAALNRFRLTPALPRAGATSALAATVLAETTFGLGVIVMVGLLGTLPPAAHVHTSSAAIKRDAAFVHIHTSEVMADVTIDPGRAGPATVTIHLWHEDYRPYAADRVELRLEPRLSEAPAVERDARHDPEGTWIADNLRIQTGGEWIVRLAIERDGKTIILDGRVVLAQCSNECW